MSGLGHCVDVEGQNISTVTPKGHIVYHVTVATISHLQGKNASHGDAFLPCRSDIFSYYLELNPGERDAIF